MPCKVGNSSEVLTFVFHNEYNNILYSKWYEGGYVCNRSYIVYDNAPRKYIKNIRRVSFDIKFTGQGFENIC